METSDPQGKKQVRSQPMDLPPSVTTVAFDPVIPPLRVPVPAGKDDEPSKGPFVLAFEDEETWRHAWYNCETKIAEQCEAGARMGCSINSAKKCQPAWWHNVFRFLDKSKSGTDIREACEEREMLVCIADAKEKCTEYAKDTCKAVFSEARIADPSLPLESRYHQNYRRVKRLSKKDAHRPVHKGDKSVSHNSTESETSLFEVDDYTERKTNFQGKILVGDERFQRSWEGPVWVDGIVHGEFPESEELTGWEGGLIWPKIRTQSFETPEGDKLKPVVALKQPFWKQYEIFLKWKLQ